MMYRMHARLELAPDQALARLAEVARTSGLAPEPAGAGRVLRLAVGSVEIRPNGPETELVLRAPDATALERLREAVTGFVAGAGAAELLHWPSGLGIGCPLNLSIVQVERVERISPSLAGNGRDRGHGSPVFFSGRRCAGDAAARRMAKSANRFANCRRLGGIHMRNKL